MSVLSQTIVPIPQELAQGDPINSLLERLNTRITRKRGLNKVDVGETEKWLERIKQATTAPPESPSRGSTSTKMVELLSENPEDYDAPEILLEELGVLPQNYDGGWDGIYNGISKTQNIADIPNEERNPGTSADERNVHDAIIKKSKIIGPSSLRVPRSDHEGDDIYFLNLRSTIPDWKVELDFYEGYNASGPKLESLRVFVPNEQLQAHLQKAPIVNSTPSI